MIVFWMNLLGEPIMALKALNKINVKLKFLDCKNRFLTPTLHRMICNAKPHVNYACSAWYSNLNEKLKKKILIPQNKFIQFCLKPNKSIRYLAKSLSRLTGCRSIKGCISA